MSESESERSADETEQPENPERETLRSELSVMPFEDLMKLKETMGLKLYNEAVLGTGSVPKPSKRPVQLKRENKNRPREMSAKRPVPFLTNEQKKKKGDNLETERFRDPRFDSRCGEYDGKQFRANFSFVSEIRDSELIELKKQLKSTDDPTERQRLRFLIQRMNNQMVEEKKRKEKEAKVTVEMEEIKKAREEKRKPYFMSDRERKTKQLVEQYVELKDKGQLDKHLERRRKKDAAKQRKKINFID